jgi:putative transposase
VSLIEQHRQNLGTVPLCEALEVPRASFYRQRSPRTPAGPVRTRKRPEQALSDGEQQTVLATLHEPRFVDKAPPQVYAQLLEEGRYLCSIRTMYRLLAAHQEVRERRAVASHPVYTQPELLATRPNEVWSWDITKLKGPVKWTCYYL